MLSNLASPAHEIDGDVITYRFSNGLVIRAEVPEKDDPLRILSLTRLQGAVLNYLMNSPAAVRGKRVFEPFAGSGALGFMALKEGARTVDFLDINSRAEEFQRATAAANRFAADQVRSITGDLHEFRAPEPYDLILANPPFLPTPDCIEGTLSSNGGSDGNALLGLLLNRLNEFLTPDGEVLVILYQLVQGGMPLAARVFADALAGRRVEFTPLQEAPVPFAWYCDAYERQHRAESDGIRRWQSELEQSYGHELTLSHFVMHIGPRSTAPGGCSVLENAAQKFGAEYVLAADDTDYMPVDGRRR
ncbi:methyltransferase [Streptomyces rochei]|uniref:methyltransferase n=1 Tax=Streptomyces rochei TaxID=1928 RepID=UPI0036909067